MYTAWVSLPYFDLELHVLVLTSNFISCQARYPHDSTAQRLHPEASGAGYEALVPRCRDKKRRFVQKTG